MSASCYLSEERHARAQRLLEEAGLRSPLRWTRLVGGANNQVFRVQAGAKSVLFKAYFRHPDDPRDRLRHDVGFAKFAWQHGVRALPQPIAWDEVGSFALFEYVEGRKLHASEVTLSRVHEALDFVLAINAVRADAGALGNAAEACFSIREHLHCVRRRLDRLSDIEVRSPLDREAAELVRGEMSDVGHALLERAEPDEPLTAADRCLSPSDFGFHNALLTGDGRLKFFDFEYAGWDDPAKLVADFFCQPECPVPPAYFDGFAGVVAGLTERPEWHLERVRVLLPVYRLKWCCILLNEFLGTDAGRRRFARHDVERRKREQLDKVRNALASLSVTQSCR